jgi:hypothetical protein
MTRPLPPPNPQAEDEVRVREESIVKLQRQLDDERKSYQAVVDQKEALVRDQLAASIVASTVVQHYSPLKGGYRKPS